jgi:hypothetical protein
MRIPLSAALLALPISLAAQDPGLLAGTVVDERMRPVAGAVVDCRPVPGGALPDVTIRDQRTAPSTLRSDASGEFRFMVPANGPWQLRATMPDGRSGELVTASPIGPLVLRLRPGFQPVRLRVRDAFGTRIAGARVHAFELGGAVARVPIDAAPDAVAISDADGMCTFSLGSSWMVVATAPDGQVGLLRGGGSRAVEVRHQAVVVDRTGAVSGRVRGVDATALRGAAVMALWSDPYLEGACRGLLSTTPVVDGRFVFTGLPAGDVSLVLQARDGVVMPIDREHNRPPAAPVVRVLAGAEQVMDLNAVAGARLGGTVRGLTQHAIAGATVVLEGPLSDQDRPFLVEHGVRVQSLVGDIQFPEQPPAPHPLWRRTVRCDERGHYQFDAVPAGTYRLRAHAADHTQVELRSEVPVAGASEDFLLAPAGAVQGIVDRGSYFHVAAIRDGDEAPTTIVILPFHGAFSLGGLAAGKWHLASSNRRELVRLGSVEIGAGRTAWIDLREKEPCVIAGRVLDAEGKPMVGGVELFHDMQRLAVDGGFEFRRGQPLLDTNAQIEVFVDDLPRRWTLPRATIGARDWHGELRLGPNELRLEVLDEQGQPTAAEVWFGGTEVGGVHLQVPVGGRVLRHLRDGRFHASAKLARGLVLWQQFDVPATTHRVLRAQPAGRVEVTVLDARGHMKPFVDVIARRADGPEDDSRIRGRTDADGLVLLTVPVGRTVITADWQQQVTSEVVVEAGKTAPVTLRVR